METLGTIDYECPRCGAKIGQRCMKTKGGYKEPCRERKEAAGYAVAKPRAQRKKKEGPGPALVQQELFEEPK